MRRRKSATILLLLLTVLFGATGGALTFASPLLRAPRTVSAPPKSTVFSQVPPSLLQGRVETAGGTFATVASLQKPVVFFAPWCPHCHALLRYLLAHHALKDVQLVAVGLSYTLADGTKGAVLRSADPPRTLAAMERRTKQLLLESGISLPWSKVDYAPVSGAVSAAIDRFPTVVARANGTEYQAVGVSTALEDWLLDGQRR